MRKSTIFLFLVMSIGVVLSIIVAVIVHDIWAGPTNWARRSAVLADGGEVFDFKALLPKPIDVVENYFSIEPLRDISLPGKDTTSQERKRQVLEALGWEFRGKKRPRLDQGVGIGKRIDIAELEKYVRNKHLFVLPTDSGNAAARLLRGIDAAQPLLGVLAERAGKYQRAEFLPSLANRELPSFLYDLESPQFFAVKQAARALNLRAAVAAEAGDICSAIQSVQAVLHLCSASLKDPILERHVSTIEIHAVNEDVIWSILRQRTASENDLFALAQSLRQLDFPQSLLMSVRGEMAMAVNCIDYARNRKGGLSEVLTSLMPDNNEDFDGLDELPARVKFGWLDNSKAIVVRTMYENSILPLKKGAVAEILKLGKKATAELNAKDSLKHPDYLFAVLLVPAMESVSARSFRAETIRRQALIACELERYYLKHKSYPVSLAAMQGFAAPADPMDGKPMRYRQTNDGRYMLWSVAFDQKDDGGVVNADGAGRGLSKTDYKGDWAWQYVPVQTM